MWNPHEQEIVSGESLLNPFLPQDTLHKLLKYSQYISYGI